MSTSAIPHSESGASLKHRRTAVLGSAYRLFYEEPVELIRGSGVHLYDTDQNAYLDAYNNVPVVGHSHPAITAAVQQQLSTINTHTRYLHPGIVNYAEDLLSLLPAPLDQVIFTCSGSEAVDLAVRTARLVTGRRGIVVTANAYHGTTTTAAELSPNLQPGKEPPAHVAVIPGPDAYRESGDIGQRMAADLRQAVHRLNIAGAGFAGFLADSLFSSDGLQPGPQPFLAPVREAVAQLGGLYLADEVQSGFGRTGSHWWGFERHGLGESPTSTPDLVILGKPMGNGLPIAAVVARPELFDEFSSQMRYFNTFGGTPVTIAAAQAVLNVLREEKLLPHAANVGASFHAGLAELAQQSSAIGQVRSAGLFLAVELVQHPLTQEPDPTLAHRIVNELRRRHILISASGPYQNVLKIRPPLVFTTAHAQLFLDIFSDVLSVTAR